MEFKHGLTTFCEQLGMLAKYSHNFIAFPLELAPCSLTLTYHEDALEEEPIARMPLECKEPRLLGSASLRKGLFPVKDKGQARPVPEGAASLQLMQLPISLKQSSSGLSNGSRSPQKSILRSSSSRSPRRFLYSDSGDEKKSRSRSKEGSLDPLSSKLIGFDDHLEDLERELSRYSRLVRFDVDPNAATGGESNPDEVTCFATKVS